MKHFLHRLRSSIFVRHAVALFFFNVVTKLLAMLGNGYAARCLGPANLGFSALILNYSQQALLLCHGGFDTVAMREIAKEPARAPEIVRTVVTARFLIALLLSLAWICLVFYLPGEIPRHVRWLGIPLILLGALNLNFVFQGLEKLPVQMAIGAGASLLSAVGFFFFLQPGVPAGSDLLVLSVAGFMALTVSVSFLLRLGFPFPLGRISLFLLQHLLWTSWRYWITALVVFLYASLQIPLIAHFLGAREAGIFRAALIFSVGVEMLYTSANNLLVPRMIAWNRNGAIFLRRRLLLLTGLYMGIGLGVTLVFWFSAPFLYARFFGPDFAAAVPLFRILLVARGIVFIGQIYAYSLVALHRDNAFLWCSWAGAVFSLSFSLPLLPRWGVSAAAWISLATEALVAGLFAWVVLHEKKKARA